MRITAIAIRHLLDGVGEQARAIEDVGIFGKETKHQSRHKVVHVCAAFILGPLGILIQQLDVELVQPRGSAHVSGVVPDLLDRRDTGQRQEEAKMVGKVRIGAGDGFAARQLFRLKGLPVGGEDKFSFGFCGGRAGAQGFEGITHSSRFTHCDMDIVALKYTTQHIGRVVVARAQALERRVFIAEGG